jgi:UDP-N-acetylglucosamine--N-acetylmuramyl-(pentapeptide) pyrophosphoryl-undecaprenol N-acetylglucosamine transferase
MRVIIAGGGTGGHVIPALAIAQQLKKQYNAEVLFIGTPRGIETRLVPQAGFPLELIQVGALKNVSLMTRVKTMFDLPRALWISGRIVSDFRPDVVIGVGGYASGPAMIAAIRRRIPTLAFEPNVVPGFANRVVARFVSAAAVHFDETCEYFRNCKVTGVPVREAFFKITAGAARAGNAGEKAKAGVPEGASLIRGAGARGASHPTLLVFGGSQGAHAINQAMIESLPGLRAKIPAFHIIHQTGQRDYEMVVAAYERLGMMGAAAVAASGEVQSVGVHSGEVQSGEVHKFIDDMPATFARADLLVCRSGASTVGEITAAGKPAIFVPFPRAADDHQNKNARALESAGAAVVVEESNLEAAYLVETIAALLNDPARRRGMSDAARSLAHPRAVQEIAEMVKRLAGPD